MEFGVYVLMLPKKHHHHVQFGRNVKVQWCTMILFNGQRSLASKESVLREFYMYG